MPVFRLSPIVYKSLVCSHSLSIREKVCWPLTNPLQRQTFVIKWRQGRVGEFRAGLSITCLRHYSRCSCVRRQARTSHCSADRLGLKDLFRVCNAGLPLRSEQPMWRLRTFGQAVVGLWEKDAAAPSEPEGDRAPNWLFVLAEPA